MLEEEDDNSQDKVVRVENLVREFLSAQTLSVLEENGLGEAIESFVDKDDKRALQDFIEDTLKEHVEVFRHCRFFSLFVASFADDIWDYVDGRIW